MGDLDPHLIIIHLAHPTHHPKRHLSRVGHFLRIHSRNQRTDRQNDDRSQPIRSQPGTSKLLQSACSFILWWQAICCVFRFCGRRHIFRLSRHITSRNINRDGVWGKMIYNEVIIYVTHLWIAWWSSIWLIHCHVWWMYAHYSHQPSDQTSWHGLLINLWAATVHIHCHHLFLVFTTPSLKSDTHFTVPWTFGDILFQCGLWSWWKVLVYSCNRICLLLLWIHSVHATLYCRAWFFYSVCWHCLGNRKGVLVTPA